MTDTGPFKALSLLSISRDTGRRSLHDPASWWRRYVFAVKSRADRRRLTVPKLAECRSVTYEQDAANYQQCRKAWAENRRHFLGRKDRAAVVRPR